MSNEVNVPDLSIVIPLFFEEECVDELLRQLRSELSTRNFDYEIVFVDDGSEDRTVEIVAAYCGDDARIRLVELSRNYGKEVALTAGTEAACGAHILYMDPDLQDPPNRIADFYEKALEGFDVVFGIRSTKADTRLNVLWSKCFWRMLNALTGLEIPHNIAVMRIVSRRFANEFLRYPERVRFIEGLFMSVGMRRCFMPVENRPRFAGRSKFTFRRRLRLAFNAIFAFSDRPLQIVTGIGSCGLLASLCLMFYFMARKLLYAEVLAGWTSLMTAILFTSSLQLMVLGLIGSYVGRAYTESKARPLYSVLTRYGIGQREEV